MDLKKKEIDQIYKLDLHEELDFEDIDSPKLSLHNASVLRVPGGWIYNMWNENEIVTSVFIPFDNEFHKIIPTNNNAQ